MQQANPTRAPAGLVLGRYRPLRPLGSGGSGSVWLARDEASGLEVALKIVPREGRGAHRAEREAAAAARLRHERCPRVYALAHDDRHVYIAYQFVPGRTLRETLRDGDLDDRAAVEAAAQILDALAHAHARGVVHRDVKPTNVLVEDGPGLSVRLLDFGLATIEEAETLTAAGDVPGTLAYISPERLAGDEAGPASDVWAAGVILWEALAGEHPFWKPSVLDSARAIEAGAPELASARPDLPKALLAAVDRALAHDPGRRPRAHELAAELRAALRRRERVRRSRPLESNSLLLDKVAGGGLAALGAGLGAAVLPFYPHGWPVGIAAAAGLAGAARPRLGLALALAAPLLPLGNLSLGLAVAYAAAAALWLAAFAREPHGGLFPALGPLLGPLSALALAPALVLRLRSPVRRAAAAGAVVLVAALAAGLRGAPLPPTGETPPLGLGIAGSEDVDAVAGALWRALLDHPALACSALALALAGALLPLARVRGPWAVAALGAALLAALLLPAPEIAAAPVVTCVWAVCSALILGTASRPLQYGRAGTAWKRRRERRLGGGH